MEQPTSVHCNERAIVRVGVVSLDNARYINAGRMEGVREGRKEGGDLVGAAVLRQSRLNFKHRPLFACYLVCPE